MKDNELHALVADMFVDFCHKNSSRNPKGLRNQKNMLHFLSGFFAEFNTPSATQISSGQHLLQGMIRETITTLEKVEELHKLKQEISGRVEVI